MDRRLRVESWGATFLAALARGQSVYEAVETAGVDRSTAYKWRHRDQDFARAWDKAVRHAAERRDAVALRRAGAGPQVADYSDRQLAILLGRRAAATKR